MDHLCCFLCLVFLMLSRLFIAALWSPAEKGLTFWLLLVMIIVFYFTYPCGILGQVWYLIVLFPDLCRIFFYFNQSPFCQVKGILILYMLVYFNRALLIHLFVKLMDAYFIAQALSFS